MGLCEEASRVVEESTPRLNQLAVPPVRYWLLKNILDKDREDHVLQRTRDECERFRPRLRLLAKLREDGTWPIPKNKKFAEDQGPGPPIGETYRTMLFNLDTLHDLVTGVDEGNVSASLGRILSWQTKDGYIPGPWTNAFPLPHFNGHALHNLNAYGLSGDRRTNKLISWLLSVQRHDGGWNIPYEMDVHYLPEYRGMRINDFREFIRNGGKSQFDLKDFTDVPSCTWCTMLVLWGLASEGRLVRTKEVDRGADFLLGRFFKRNPHPNFYLSESHWTKLGYPIRFGNGLGAISILTRMGYGQWEPRMERPIRWLLGARAQDGLWTQTGRPNPVADQWITLIALISLKRYAGQTDARKPEAKD